MDKYNLIYKVEEHRNATYVVNDDNNQKYIYKIVTKCKNTNEFDYPKLLNHPNIVDMVEYKIRGRSLHIIYKYIDGFDIYDVVNDISEYNLKEYAREMAKCIKICHDKDIVHLDIKAENFIVTCTDPVNLVLIDFEFSKKITKEVEKIPNRMGTFLAPEIYELKYSKKSDIWSLGSTVYCLFTNEFVTNEFKTDKFNLKYHLKNIRPHTKNFENFLIKLLSYNMTDRATIDEVLEHPWLN